MSKTLVVNLFGGPGTGKSTTMAHVFAHLKWRGVNCEMAPEWVKAQVWAGNLNVLADQVYIFAKQLRELRRLAGKVDVIVTDSPLLLNLVYGERTRELDALVRAFVAKFDNFNVFLTRVKPYQPAGRVQTEAGAKEKDAQIRALFPTYASLDLYTTADMYAAQLITACTLARLKARADK